MTGLSPGRSSLPPIAGVLGLFAVLVGAMTWAVFALGYRPFVEADTAQLAFEEPRIVTGNSIHSLDGCIGQAKDLGCAFDTWLACKFSRVPAWCAAVGVRGVSQTHFMFNRASYLENFEAAVNFEIRPVTADLQRRYPASARSGQIIVEYTNLSCQIPDDRTVVCETELDRAAVVFERARGRWQAVRHGSNQAGLSEEEDEDWDEDEEEGRNAKVVQKEYVPPCYVPCRMAVADLPIRGSDAIVNEVYLRARDLKPPPRKDIRFFTCFYPREDFDLRVETPHC